MGLLSAGKLRRAERERRLQDATYKRAIEQGKQPEQAALLAERALQQRRRRHRIIFGATG